MVTVIVGVAGKTLAKKIVPIIAGMLAKIVVEEGLKATVEAIKKKTGK